MERAERVSGARRSLRRWTAAALLTVGCLSSGSGQYYERRSYEPSAARYIAGGVFFRDFAPRPGNSAPDPLVIRYTRIMPMLMFRQGPLDVTIGYTTYELPGSSRRAAIFLSSTLMNELPVAGSRENALVIPVVIAADFSKNEAAGSERDHFNIASIGLGTGLKYRMRGGSVDVAISAVGVMHYSFEGYSIRGGSSPAVLGEAVALFNDVPILEGIAAGYRFRYQSWNTGGFFDYRTVNHGIFIGVMF